MGIEVVLVRVSVTVTARPKTTYKSRHFIGLLILESIMVEYSVKNS